MTHAGHLYLLKNEPDTAGKAHLEALKLFPEYHYAIANLARVRTAQGEHRSALELYRKHHALAPHAPNLYELALAMERAGETQEAAEAFARFEAAAAAQALAGL